MGAGEGGGGLDGQWGGVGIAAERIVPVMERGFRPGRGIGDVDIGQSAVEGGNAVRTGGRGVRVEIGAGGFMVIAAAGNVGQAGGRHLLGMRVEIGMPLGVEIEM